MATSARLYRNPESEVTVRPRYMTTTEFAEFSALARDLAQLCSEEMLEAFNDEEGTMRFRPKAKP